MEKDAVQIAFDRLMTDARITRVKVEANATRSLTGFPTKPDGSAVTAEGRTLELADYLRGTESLYFYCWDSRGKITRQAEGPVPC